MSRERRNAFGRLGIHHKRKERTMAELRVGTLCYYDSITGLVKGKVSAIRRPNGHTEVDILVTADGGPYKRGETITTSPTWAIPRKAVRRTKHSTRIGQYTVIG